MALDRRVRKEARLLLREARGVEPRLQGPRAAELRVEIAEAARRLEQALAAGDLGAVRRALPPLDQRLDDLPRIRRSALPEYAWSIGTLVVLVLSIRAFVVEAFKIPSSSMYPTLEINDHIFVNKFIYGLRVPLSHYKLFERSPRRGEVIVFIQPCQPDRDYIKRVVGLAGDRIEVRCNVLYVNGEEIKATHVPGPCEYLDGEDGSRSPHACSRYRETLGGYTFDTFHDPERPQRELDRRAAGGLPDGDRQDFPLSTMLPRCSPAPDLADRAPQKQEPGTVIQLPYTQGAFGACRQQLQYVVPEGHVFAMGDNRSGSNDSRGWGAVPIGNIKGKALFIWLAYEHWSLGDWTGVQWGRIGDFVH